MFIRTIETIKDLFRHGKKYIKAKDVYMYIRKDGGDIKIFYKKNGEKYNLNDEKISIDLKQYNNLSVAGRWGSGIGHCIKRYVKVSDNDMEIFEKVTDYLQKGYKYGKYLPLDIIDCMAHNQNRDNVMPWHKYNKFFLQQLEDDLNIYLSKNERVYDSNTDYELSSIQ